MSDEDRSKGTPVSRVLKRPVTFEPDGERLSPMAVCPRRLGVVRVEDCGICKDFASLRINPEPEASFMLCAFEEARFVRADEAATRSPERGERALVRDAMSLPPRCATLDMTLARVMSDLLNGADAVPVIDGGGRALGVITRVDVLERLQVADRADPETLVGDMMLSRSLMVSADASLAHVAAVMAYERVHHVLVAAADGKLLGLVSALDIARWFARRAGYVVPALERS